MKWGLILNSELRMKYTPTQMLNKIVDQEKKIQELEAKVENLENFIKDTHKESLEETDWCMGFMHKLLGDKVRELTQPKKELCVHGIKYGETCKGCEQ